MTQTPVAPPAAPLEDPRFTTPLYTIAQAASVLAVPTATLRDWATGYLRKRVGAQATIGQPVVTTAEPPTPQGPSLPFVGLAEAYILAAFTAAGVPLQRIRPAILRLQQEVGLEQALASERLKTDGAEVLWDYGRTAADRDVAEAVDHLVVVRNQQGVFREVVQDYLARVVYREGWIQLIRLPRYPGVDVTVDPRINFGQPTLARRGIRVADVLNRVRAGEDPEQVAYDYDLRPGEVQAVLRATS